MKGLGEIKRLGDWRFHRAFLSTLSNAPCPFIAQSLIPNLFLAFPTHLCYIPRVKLSSVAKVGDPHFCCYMGKQQREHLCPKH